MLTRYVLPTRHTLKLEMESVQGQLNLSSAYGGVSEHVALTFTYVALYRGRTDDLVLLITV